MKKLFVLLLGVLLIAGVFSACTTDEKPQETTTTQTTDNVFVTEKPEETIDEPFTVPEATEPEAKPTDAVSETLKPTKATETKNTANSQKTPSVPETKVSKDDAKKAVLNHAGLSASDISRYKSELDRERGTLVYEIEFDYDRYEYEYEVDANSGKILKSEKEFRD